MTLKILLFVVGIISVESVLSSNVYGEIKIKYVTQPTDHFKNNSLEWDMRYFERRTYWKPGGPIFIYIGGEFKSRVYFLKRSGMVRLARATNGAMFMTEHRYYGEKEPPGIDGRNKFEYLSSRQALADVAHFVGTLKTDRDFVNSKVVVIGVSYSGSLASWMRQLYPHLVDAAWASSAPVLATLDFREYYEQLGHLYRAYGGDACYANIEKLFEYQTSLFNTSRTEQLKEEQNICGNVHLKKPLNKQVYFHNYVSRFDQHRNPREIIKICELISNGKHAKKSLHTIEFSNNLNKLRREYSCDPGTFEYMPSNKSDDIAWAWQCCSEFGFFITTSSHRHPFSNNIPLEYSLRKCSMYFGDEFNEDFVRKRIENTNNLYGGASPNVTRVIFVNGLLDPWKSLGVLQDLSPDAPAVLIKDAGHGQDFKPMKSVDSKELKAARQFIERSIKKWIS